MATLRGVRIALKVKSNTRSLYTHAPNAGTRRTKNIQAAETEWRASCETEREIHMDQDPHAQQ